MIDEGRVNGVWNVGTSTWVWKYGIREKMHLSFSTFSSTDSFQLVSGIMHARLVGCRPTMKTVKKRLFLEFVCNFPNQWILFLQNTKYLGILAYNSMDNIRIYTNCSWLQVSTDELLTIGKIQNDLPQESFALNYWEISKRFVLNFIVP